MAKIPGKGASFSLDLGEGSAAVGQCISISLPEGEHEVFESDTTDNEDAGIPYQATMRTEGGSVEAEIFLDNTSHASLLAILASPAEAGFACVIGFRGGTSWSMTLAGLKFGGGSIVLNDGVKTTIGGKLSGHAA